MFKDRKIILQDPALIDGDHVLWERDERTQFWGGKQILTLGAYNQSDPWTLLLALANQTKYCDIAKFKEMAFLLYT